MPDTKRTEATISAASVERVLLPLHRPYRLSFQTLECFDTLIATVESDSGGVARGDLVLLSGYYGYDDSYICEQMQRWCGLIVGRGIAAARRKVADHSYECPAAASPVLSALDVLGTFDTTLARAGGRIPLVAAIAADDPSFLANALSAADEGYRTLKVKVGRDLAKDLEAVRVLSEEGPRNTLYRFDANQAYSVAQARSFIRQAEGVLLDRTELIEQPLGVGAWDEMSVLCRESRIPLMLDEDIVSAADITRAAQCGCALVKLKLGKHGGLRELLDAAAMAAELRLRVVIGNGVATNITNYYEVAVRALNPDLFAGACEANGFLKLTDPVDGPSPGFERGFATLPAGSQ